ncbi:MAG: GyrI-like domain-containing protein [Methanobrevibacter sp.]|jgi:hypothetical protein|nr:GyrI-like domain-containing protein [Methanobrevibacter sp.]
MKVDFKKEYKELYKSTAKKVSFVNVPNFKFLAIDGKGDPNTSKEYKDSIEALMSVSFKTKFLLKKEQDYVVMPLEGLWYADKKQYILNKEKDKWKWTSLIMQPNFVEKEDIKEGMEEASKKKDLLLLNKLRFIEIEEGLSAQTLHIGPYDNEESTLAKLYKEIEENNYKFNGHHHEIYLSDLRRTKPEKLKTILRQPIK